MTRLLRILHLEDDPRDLHLLRTTLDKADFRYVIETVQTRERFTGALETMKFDLILSDSFVQGFDGRSALKLVLQKFPETPFIFLSGTKGEGEAIEGLVRGAVDFVFKEKIERLIPAVRRALHKRDTERTRRRTEAELRESNERYRTLFENSIGAILVSTADGEVLECNFAYLQLFGFSSEKEARTAGTEFLFGDDLKKIELLKKIQEEREIELSDIPVRTTRGNTIHIAATIIAKLDDRNVLGQFYCFLTDNTKLRLLEDRLDQDRAFEKLRELAEVIGHNLNNVLGVITGHAALIARMNFDKEKAAKSANAVIEAAQRGGGLVRQLLTSATNRSAAVQSFSVNDSVEGAAHLIRKMSLKRISLSTEIDEALPLIVKDSSALHETIMNLCLHASNEIPEEGTLRISTRSVEEREMLVKYPTAERSNYVLVEVAVIPERTEADNRSVTCEPSSDMEGRGNNADITPVLGAISSNEGFVDVVEAAKGGKTYSLFLPVHSKSSHADYGSASFVRPEAEK